SAQRLVQTCERGQDLRDGAETFTHEDVEDAHAGLALLELAQVRIHDGAESIEALLVGDRRPDLVLREPRRDVLEERPQQALLRSEAVADERAAVTRRQADLDEARLA